VTGGVALQSHPWRVVVPGDQAVDARHATPNVPPVPVPGGAAPAHEGETVREEAGMPFEIVLSSVPHATLRRQIIDTIGLDRVSFGADRAVLAAPDQPAAIGILTLLNELGLDIEALRRTPD
jgi:hypothetical protein